MLSVSDEKIKYYYKIGELEKITGVSSSKIRYWTNKFESLKKQLRTTSGYTHKLYHHDAIEIIISLNKFHNEIKINTNYNNFDKKLSEKIDRGKNIIKKLQIIKNKIQKIIDAP
tara:strand:+ start:4088 stop:4429 length:342 start_codon:yes stop_codon:yes gene_type:complete